MIPLGRKAIALAVVAGMNLVFVGLSLAIGSGFLLLVAILFAFSSGAFALRLLAV